MLKSVCHPMKWVCFTIKHLRIWPSFRGSLEFRMAHLECLVTAKCLVLDVYTTNDLYMTDS